MAPPVTGPLPLTFFISGQCGADHGPFRKFLTQTLSPPFKEVLFDSDAPRYQQALSVSDVTNHVGFLLLEQTYHYNHKETIRYDPRVAQLTACIKSQLPAKHKQALANKHVLYRNLMSYANRQPGDFEFISQHVA